MSHRRGHLRGAGHRLALITVTLAMAMPSALVAAALTVGLGQRSVCIERFVYILEDPDSALGIEAVAAPSTADRFAPNRGGCMIDLGGAGSTWWLRFSLENREPRETELFLEVGNPLLDRVELFHPLPAGGFRTQLVGDLLPFADRPFRLRHFVLPLRLPAETTSTFYLRIRTTSLLAVPLQISSPGAFLEHRSREQLLLGLTYGVLLGTILYNLFLFFSVREAIYLYLAGQTVALGLVLAAMDGLLFPLWPQATGWQQWALHVAVAATSVTTILFVRRLVHSAERSPDVDRALLVFLGAVAVSAALAAPWGARAFGMVNLFWLVVVSLGLVLTLAWHARRGNRPARIYFAGWLIALLVIAVGGLSSFGFLPALHDPMRFLRLGAIAGVLFASLAVVVNLAQTRRALEVSETRFAKAFQASPDGITISTLSDGRFLDVNEAFEKISGHSRKAMLGRTSLELGLWPPRLREQAVAILRREGRLRDLETEIQTRSGERNPVLLSVEPVRIDGEDCVVAVLRDIRELTRAREQRERLITELETKNTELEAFTYTVSHDLKTPLVTIAGFAGLLEQDAVSGNLERLFDGVRHIRDATRRMRALLDDLLELSRVGHVVQQAEKVALAELAEEARLLIDEKLKERGIEVVILPGLPTVVGDRVRLLQVLQNLLDNAVRFVDKAEDPQIEIGVRKLEEETICFVRDNGLGIEPRYHEKVFGLFERVDPTTEGSGIGLALARRIVEYHGGRIWVESESGQGATFCFVIPETPPSEIPTSEVNPSGARV